jgi:hypothetical protein
MGLGYLLSVIFPKGANIFEGDTTEMVWIDKSEIVTLEPEIRRLCDDFCVIKGKSYGCPENFNSLTIGWYLNESKDNPNVRCTNDYDFVAIHDIKKGEELLANYSEYSDYPDVT